MIRPEFVRAVLDHPPSRRLHWHYFMLWQILGLKLWQEMFQEGTQLARDRRSLASRDR